MKITVFAKTAHTQDGKPFTRFIGRMTKKDGTDVSMTIRTSSKAGNIDVDKTPYIIEFNKEDANLSNRKYKDKDGVERTSYTLWLKKFKESSEKFVDHSLDDFD